MLNMLIINKNEVFKRIKENYEEQIKGQKEGRERNEIRGVRVGYKNRMKNKKQEVLNKIKLHVCPNIKM